MNEESIDQTAFLQDPMTSEAPAELPMAQVPLKPKSKRPLLLIGVGGGVLVLLIILGAVSSMRRSGPVASTVTPTPSSAPVEGSGIRAEIAPFLQTIDTLNPESDENPFPPVHFEVRIKEPGSK